MRIGILGGTGKEGAGLALRWAQAGHEIIIGSRDAERARAKAAEISAQAGRTVGGMSNREAAAAAEIVILALPASGLAATLGELKDACRGKVVISTVVPLSFGGGRLFPRRARVLRGRSPGLPARGRVVPLPPTPPKSSPRRATNRCDSCSVADADAKKRGRAGSGMGLRAVDVDGPHQRGAARRLRRARHDQSPLQDQDSASRSPDCPLRKEATWPKSPSSFPTSACRVHRLGDRGLRCRRERSPDRD